MVACLKESNGHQSLQFMLVNTTIYKFYQESMVLDGSFIFFFHFRP